MLQALKPDTKRLSRGFAALLKERAYDTAQIRALLAITPVAATRFHSIPQFLEQVQTRGRELAGLMVPPEQVRATLREMDRLAAAELKGRFEPAREHLALATLLKVNQAFYDVREREAQALFGVARAALASNGLDDLLRRIVGILTQTFHARAGRLILIAKLPDKRLAIPLYIRAGRSQQGLILDPAIRSRYECFWSYPLRGAGVVQLAFAGPRPWLPRELWLLDAAIDRAHAAIELRRMEACAREAEEEERRRIGRELHDEAGQSLLALRMELERMEQVASGPLRSRLREAHRIAAGTAEELRRIISALSPAVLERLGLGAALRQLAARFERSHRVRVTVRIAREAGEISSAPGQVIYRVAQESLQNIARHAQANEVRVFLSVTDMKIRLSVVDNGAGFSVEAAARQPMSFGLAGMRERAAYLGGSLAIRSAPGRGASVRLELPRHTDR
jgi:signal transduction histidine kinase